MMEFAVAFVPGFVLTFVRVTAMVSAMMLLGATGESRWPRLVLSFALSAILFARRPVILDPGDSLIGLGLVAGREAVLGFALGFAVLVITVVLRTAGSLLGHEMGFSMSRAVDPVSGFPSPVVGRLFETLAMLFLFAVDGHHQVFRILSDTFDRIPIGRAWSIEGLVQGLLVLTGDGLQLAISLASPVYAVLMLVSVVLVVLARVVPQVHLMEFGFALRILIAMSVMLIFFTMAAPYIYRMFAGMFGRIDRLVVLMAG